MASPARLRSAFAQPWAAVHATIAHRTGREIEFVDLTDRLVDLVAEHGLECGVVTVQARHTTTGIVVNELEPLLLDDFRRTLERAAPRLGGYAHDDFRRRANLVPGERVNGHAHCQALLLRSSESINVAGGALCLGRWQRVMLVELDGPQPREVSVTLLGATPWGRI
jgi:secondary thiamine-phosphate synthase enzyme